MVPVVVMITAARWSLTASFLAATAVPVPMPWWFQLALGPMGVLVLCILIGWSGAKKDPVWVWGREHREIVARLDAIIIEAQTTNRKLTELGFKALEGRPGGG